ncbi:hypothetical protein ACFLV4_04285 [Chloroflexota bacterium]
MNKWSGNSDKPKEPETKLLWGRVFNIVESGLDEEQVVSFVNELTEKYKVPSVVTPESSTAMGSSLNHEVADTAEVEAKAQFQEEIIANQPLDTGAKGFLEQPLEEERRETETAQTTPSEQYDKTPYNGDVQLILDVPVNMKMVSELFDNLQTIRELRILNTTGSPNRGIAININIERPIPLVDMIASKLPGVEVTPEIPGKGENQPRKIISILERKKSGAHRIRLTSRASVTSIIKDS